MGAWARWAKGIAEALRQHRVLTVLVLGYVAAGMSADALLDTGDSFTPSLYSERKAMVDGLFLVLFFTGHALYMMIFVRPRRLGGAILDDLRTRYLTAERLSTALPLLILMPLFISTFTFFKVMIPVINPYSWDATLMALDRALLGGLHPWQALQPLLGYPLVTTIINTVYNLWFFVMFAIVFWQTFSLANRRLRMRFFLTFVLTWGLLGSLLATALSSAGPVYFARVTGGEDVFLPLMDYLRQVDQTYPVLALAVQEFLWQGYLAGDQAMGSGISAMPSMHMSSAFLFALLGWRTNRVLGWALTVFAAFIFLGSIHLGWHYALDSYVSIPATWAVWWGVGRMQYWRQDKTKPRSSGEMT